MQELLSPYGPIEEVTIIKDKLTGESKGRLRVLLVLPLVAVHPCPVCLVDSGLCSPGAFAHQLHVLFQVWGLCPCCHEQSLLIISAQHGGKQLDSRRVLWLL
jgi:hypothetical protein